MRSIISIVDDDKPVREALQRMLNSHGFTASAFGSAEEFLNSDASQRAACLIADVKMPGMTGIALHKYLISQGCRIPTILITALPTSGERERALSAGALSYLAKPLSEAVLLAIVRDALERGSRADVEDVPEQARPRN
jgi:FixJ family two-component response regulator